jgi:hypothetical protein
MGVQTWPRGDRYEGKWENDTRTGVGSYRWAEGDCYTGGWQNGLRHFQGRYEWPDGRSYEGEWAENNRNGQGTYRWPDGACYQGSWLDNKRHGQGVMHWADGRLYEGQWHMDARVGPGGEQLDQQPLGPFGFGTSALFGQASQHGGLPWDRFFLRSIPEQRAFMQEFVRRKQGQLGGRFSSSAAHALPTHSASTS